MSLGLRFDRFLRSGHDGFRDIFDESAVSDGTALVNAYQFAARTRHHTVQHDPDEFEVAADDNAAGSANCGLTLVGGHHKMPTALEKAFDGEAFASI